jgi:hypothetical protein
MRYIILALALTFGGGLVGDANAQTDAVDDPMSVAAILNSEPPWVGDLDGMIARRAIRALVVYSKTFYFLDGAKQRGLSFDLLNEFESFVNRKFKTGTLKINVILTPANWRGDCLGFSTTKPTTQETGG